MRLMVHSVGTLAALVWMFASGTEAQQLPSGVWELRNPSVRPSPRVGHVMAYEGHLGSVLLQGGNNPWTNETWRWDGETWWDLSSVPVRPPARSATAMVYDSIRERVVLFGGDSTGNDTWEWDGSSWHELNPVQRPEWRYSHAMAFDRRRARVVLFGGWALYPDTWLWDGTNWSRATMTGPSPRGKHRMAYDELREVVVLFGGTDSTRGFNDMWEWNGTVWTEVLPLNQPPAPRALHVMTYHAARQRILVYGGIDGPLHLTDETWEFDTSSRLWWRIPLTTNPGLIYLEDVVYDARRSRAVLFGGNNPFVGRRDQTWTYQDLNLAAVPAQPRPGEAVSLTLDVPANPGLSYLLAASFRRVPGIPLPDARWISLQMDRLFEISLGSNAPPFSAFAGTLDPGGRAQASVTLPSEPGLVGLSFVVGGITFDAERVRTVLTEAGIVVRGL